MASTAAQEEFNALVASQRASSSRHPEDAYSSDHSDTVNNEPTAAKHYEKDSDSDTRPSNTTAKSTYFIPKLRSEANTGPKGVIADAQAFEQAKKQHRFSWVRKQRQASPPRAYRAEDFEKSSEEEEDEDGFLARWRERRLKELSDRKYGRNSSPGSRRIWGSLTKVDAEGYLDAIEQVGKGTVVVVFIYDHASEVSIMVEDCVRELAKVHSTTRFVKLHYVEAEMEPAGVPALLAYRGAEKFAGLVPVMDEIPDEEELSSRTLGAVLSRHQILQ
ncbi:thioredoxin-like protein [Tothia fuscella]|uniref:Thioredoxin-like protein n=1 Tax=Tothia fuscella TaxID=1048955 RepID=A0A9P4NKE9_9PEZI|nr:thioredoxin-like protein [Tothia fuscella]